MIKLERVSSSDDGFRRHGRYLQVAGEILDVEGKDMRDVMNKPWPRLAGHRRPVLRRRSAGLLASAIRDAQHCFLRVSEIVLPPGVRDARLPRW